MYNDLKSQNLIFKFKDYIYSLVDVEKGTFYEFKTPAELLDEAGYILYECKSEEDIQKLYGNDPNAAMKVRLDKQKADIERVRVGIIKEVAFQIQEFKNKIASNSRE